MLIRTDGTRLLEDDQAVMRRNGYEYAWSGFLFARGRAAGADSVSHIADEFEHSSRIPFSELCGAFCMVIRKPDGSIYVFTDNSGMHVMYLSVHAISDRFLALTHYLTDELHLDLTLSPEAVAQSYAIGRTLFNKTLIEEITLSESSAYFVIENCTISPRSKEIGDIDHQQVVFDPSSFFDDLAKALVGIGASVALTGGYDSRLVFAFLKSRMEILPSLSGDNKDHAELTTAAEVAERAGFTLNLVETTKPALSDEQVEKIFQAYDGTCGFAQASTFRLYEFFQSLANRGIGIHMTGDGGVLHKDWEWMQDLPFYRRKKTNLKKFYHQRLAFNWDGGDAGSYIEAEIEQMEERVLPQLSRYVMSTNTQSYDMLYYHVNGRRDQLYNLANHGVQMYAPLLEKDFVSYSYGLPRLQRFFYNNMRKLVTGEDSEVARVPTVYGTTESSEPLYIIRDVWFQTIDYGRKLIRMVGRSAIGKTYFAKGVSTWSIDKELRELAISRRAVAFCESIGVVERGASTKSLSVPHIECTIQVFLIAKTAGMVDS